MHGNVAEWTRSTYRPYPLPLGDPSSCRTARKTIRGGSWLDRPRRARSAFRLHYEPSQAIHDVGFHEAAWYSAFWISIGLAFVRARTAPRRPTPQLDPRAFGELP